MSINLGMAHYPQPRKRGLTEKESAEHRGLLTLWATKRATRKQMLRCLELGRKEVA